MLLHARCVHHRLSSSAAAAAAPPSAAAAAAARRRLCLPPRSQKGGISGAGDGEDLIRQLNASPAWLPAEESEFGLDDVAEHLASRDQALPLDLSQPQGRKGGSANSSTNSSKRQAAAGGSASSSSLADLVAAEGGVPAWVEQLRADGFDVLGRNGEVFLQRGAVNSSGSGAGSDADARRRAQAAAGSSARSPPGPRQQQQQQPQQQIPDRMLAVRPEFAPSVWSQQPGAAATSQQATGSTWYGAAGAAAAHGSSSTAPAAAPTGRRGGVAASAAVQAEVQQQLLGFAHPSQLLSHVEACFPAWAANGCWLVDQARLGVVAAPTPAEAATCLKGVALAAKRSGLSASQTQGLARDRRVRGLVECLRLVPPRSAPHQPANLSQRLWSIAKDYWLQAGAAASAAQQQLLAAAQAAAGGGSGQQGGAGMQLGGAGELVISSLLAQLQLAGVVLSRQQLAAAQTLVRARQEQQLRRSAFVSGLWGLSVLGGDLFFQQDMEALLQVAAFGRWQLRSAEVADVLWGLAHARHWCPRVQELETALLADGGVHAATPAELVTVIWAFATLSHQPQQLLAQLEQHGWCGKPAAAASSQRGSKRKQQRQQQQQQGGAARFARLSELPGGRLATLVWSLAVLQQTSSELFMAAWAEVCRRGPQLAAEAGGRGLVALHQAALAVQLEAHYAPTELYCDQGTRELLEAAADAFQQQSSSLQGKVHSTYQRSIASTLAKLQLPHVLEDNTSGYSVDVSVPALRVAIEADGPSHTSRTAGPQARPVQLGATAMKRRHLQGLGWRVINLSYSDWDKQQGEAARAGLLLQLIKAAVAQPARAST